MNNYHVRKIDSVFERSESFVKRALPLLALLVLPFISLGQVGILMEEEGSSSTCDAMFYDPSGPGQNYAPPAVDGETVTHTVCSSTGGPVWAIFHEFGLWGNNCVWGKSKDKLKIYNGSDTNAPLIGTYEGSALAPGTASAIIEGSSGCLTFEFIKENKGGLGCSSNEGAAGWTAEITCVEPPMPETGDNCFEAVPFCSDIDYTFENNYGGSNPAPSGPDYGCLYSQPNAIWYYLKIGESGPIQLHLAQNSTSGSGIDIDFAMWGPFTDVFSGCNAVMGGQSPLQCSYSASATETIGIGVQGGVGAGQSTPAAAQEGEYYIVVMTNYNGSPGTISLSQTGGTGATDCSIVDPCIISEVTATPTACDENTFSVSGTVSFLEPPLAGQLVVKDCNGNQVTFDAPFTSPISYTIEDIATSLNTQNCEVEAYFTANSNCSKVSEVYVNPADCVCNPPQLNINDLSICSGHTVSLQSAIGAGSDQSVNTFYTSQADAENKVNAIGNNVGDEGTYWVRAETTTSSSCFETYQIEVEVTVMDYQAVITPEYCDKTNGSIDLSVTGGNIPYQFSIDLGESSQASGLFNNLGSGTYEVRVVDDSGCEAEGQETIPFVDGPTIDNINITDMSCYNSCDGGLEVVVSGGDGSYDYEWKNASGNSVGSNVSISDVCDGDYTIEVVDGNDCIVTATETIDNPDPAVLSLSLTNPTCGNTDGIIVISGVAGNGDFEVSYNYGGVNSGIINTASNAIGEIVITGLAEGNYSGFEVLDVNGCIAINNSTVTLNEPDHPTIVAPEDKTICEGETLVLAGSASSGAVITWDNDIINGVPFAPEGVGAHVYTVTATLDNCTISDQMEVTVIATPEPDFFSNDLVGCPTHMVFFENTTNVPEGSTCTWDFGNGKTAELCGSIGYGYTQSGIYTVSYTVETPEGCVGTMTKTDYVDIKPAPVANLEATPMEPSISKPEVDFINLSTNFSKHAWDFGDETQKDTTMHPTHLYPIDVAEDYIVTLTVESDEGCVDTLRMLIIVNDELLFYIPNTFTPNADGDNDYFAPVFTSGFDPYDYHLTIYNRWGEVVFESFDASIGWDGTYGGGITREGMYVWKIEFQETMSDERHTKLGHLLLLK